MDWLPWCVAPVSTSLIAAPPAEVLQNWAAGALEYLGRASGVLDRWSAAAPGYQSAAAPEYQSAAAPGYQSVLLC
jgi:hypothetical protein